ncbi:MAG: VWA domain-containing protein [Candidatus Buchananbacteria bacterium]|nr:VWA domain-containing protein [Candidatus Buchananbacteria bacterium]
MIPKKSKIKKLILPIVFGLVLGSFLVGSSVLALETGLGYGTFSGLGTQDLRVSVMNVVRAILGFLGVLAIVIIFYGGFIWMTAGGNADRIATAKKILTNAVIGLVIIFTSFAITSFVINQLINATGAGGGGITPGSCDEPSDVGAVNGCYVCTDFGSNYGWQVDCSINGCCPGPAQCGVVSITPSSPPNQPMNAVVRVRFNLPTITGVDEIQVIDTTTGNPVAVNRTVVGNVVEIRPTAFCAAPQDALNCFPANTTFNIAMNSGSIQCGGQNLVCGGFPDPCQGSFTTGDFVDIAGPTVELVDRQICQGTTNELRALVNDDYGIDNVQFFDTTYGVLISTDTNVSVPPEGFATGNWDTSTYAINEFVTVEARASDYDSHVATDQLQFTIRAGHCCNAVQDGDETGLNCGGNDCEACNPVIEWVSPLNGEQGNLITVHGRHFGDIPGTVTFLGAPNDGGADNQDGLNPASINPQCSNYWTDTEIVTVVPDAQDGPIMVRANNGTVDTTNELPGNTIADFDRNDVERPGICTVVPSSGEPGDAVVIHGLRLDAGSEVYFSSVLAGGTPVADGLMVTGATVPNLDPAQVGLRVKNQTQFSNPKTFSVGDANAPGQFQCSSDQLTCSPDQSKCTPDKFCNSSCNCEPRQTCDTNTGTPSCEPSQGLCDPGWFCYNPLPDGTHQPDPNKLACHCYQAQFCDDPTLAADVQNPACHPNDGACPDNYTCDPNSNCTCQPVSSIGDDSAYGWFFQSGIKPGSCSNEAGICDPNSALCNNGETCNPTTCNCEPTTQFACSSDPNVCSPDPDLCETGTFCNQTCQCETLVPCDADPNSPSCEPSACPQSYFCYSASVGDPGYDAKKLDCYCYPGILCDGDISTPVCDPDNDFCPTDYECNPNSCFCEAQVKVSDSSTYTWFFNTTSFGPRVVESCNRSNTCDIDSYSSPSPYNVSGTRAGGYTVSGARPDDGAIPVDSIITAMFTTEMVENSINETSVIVLRCNEASQPFNPTSCGAQQIIDDNGIDVHGCDYLGEAVTCFDFEPSALLTKNYWYQVTLNTSQIFGTNGVNLIGNSIDNNYRWVFKTRDSDELSRVACVYVEPTYQTAYNLGAEHDWNAYVSPEDFVCVLMNPDRSCTWDWTTSDGRATVIDQNGNEATTQALAETLPDPPVDVIASCTFSDGQKDGEGKLTIDLTSPYVIDKFPDCGTACLNARIGATFSRAMDAVSVTDAMTLYICYNNPNCEIGPANEVTSFSKPTAPAPDEAPNTFVGDMPCFDVNDDGKYDYCLLPDTYYRVVINNTAVSANDNKPLAGLNFDDPTLGGTGDLDSYSWIFKTQADAGLCLPDRIDVFPQDEVTPVDTTINYASRPRTAGDACDPEFGQRLNPYIWSWDYDTNLVSRQFDNPFCSGYEVANLLSTAPQNYCTERLPGSLRQSCGNNVIEIGESCDDGNLVNGDGCSNSCLHEGTVTPTCGDGKIGAGEECETPGSNYCGADCLWVGNTDYDLEVCGNGIVELSEMCEYPNTPGCGATCLLSGTTGAAICGNGVIDRGEECDEAERLNGDAPSSGDYNGDGISCGPTCLIENRGIGVCRSVATNKFDFTQNGGSCNTGYVAVPLNTATGNSNVGSVCGNRITELGEQCDLGGRCSDNNKPCTVSNLSNCANSATATCEPRDTYCFDPGNATDGQTCPTPGSACGTSGVCIANTCTVECLNAGYPSGFYSDNISPYQIAAATKDGETYIQSWIGGYSPVDTGPMGEGHLLVGNGGGNQFVIVERWPDCGSACLNADIGGRFSKSADPNTVNDLQAIDLGADRIFLYECGLDYSCAIDSLEPIEVSVDSYIEEYVNDAFRINLPLFYNLIDHDNNPSTPMVNALLPNTNYRVVVRNTVTSAEGLALTGLNFDDPYYDYQNPDTGSRLDSHSWVFRTQDTSEICSLDSVNVNPDDYYSESDASVRYSSEPRSEPDVCDPRYGQRLNPFYYDWNWDDEEVTGNPTPPPTFLNSAEFALPLRDGCGNALLQFGEDCDDGNLDNGDGCSSVCLNEGTTAPTCGNNKIDRGEECEPPSTGYCGANCLLIGNDNYTPIALGGYRLDDVCGNGVVEPGEECDEGTEPNGNEADGCTDYCRYTGSVPAALSICGDGQIGLGEECDDADFSNGSPVASGDGCSGTDPIAACTGLDRTACTAFPAANTCYWTGSTCKTRPCLVENRNVAICRSDRAGEFDFNQSPAACEDGYDPYNLTSVSGNNNFETPICGNRVIEEGEECDLGGRCSDNGRRCIPTDLSNCANPKTAVCELALGICTSDGTTCTVIGSACGSGGTCFSTGCSAECLNAGAIEDSLLQDTLIDPYQVVNTLSVPTVLAEVNEEIKAFATIQPNAVGVGLLHVVPGSQVDFAVIGHQPAIGATNQCLNVGIWALFSRPLNTETLSADSIRLCQGGDCSLVKNYSYRIVQGECGDDSFCHFPEHLSDVDSFGVCHNDFDCVGGQLIVRSLNTDTGFLDPNQDYEVRVDQNNLQDINGMTLAEANTCNGQTSCEWGFSSGTDFCECEYVSVSINPTTGGSETVKDLFTCAGDDCGSGTVSPFDDDAANGNPATEQNLAGNQHLYDTVCYDIHNNEGGRIPLLPTGLRFEWAVFPNDDLIYLTDSDATDFINDASFVTPNNKNGDSDVFITAYEYHCGDGPNFCDPQSAGACGDCGGDKAVNQTVRVTNFMCNNPWPGVEVFEDSDTNCDDANNCYDTNFTMLYCRDQGQEGVHDDLPPLYEDPLVLGNNPASPAIKDFIFTFASTGVNRTVNDRTPSNKTWTGGVGSNYQFTVAQTGNYAVKIDGYNYPTPGWGNSADLSSRVQPNPALFDSNVNYNGFNIDVYLRTGTCSASPAQKSGTAVLLPYDETNPQTGSVSLGQLTAGETYCMEFRWTNDWCKCNPECLASGGTLDDQCDANFHFLGWQVISENTSNDAIGIRVLENPLHLSPTTWYSSGLCGGVAEFDSLCFSDADCLVPNDNGLIAYYPLDGVEADYSGNELDGLKNTNAPYLPGKFGQAANFSSADEWIEVASNSKLQVSGELTVSAWVNLNEGLSGANPDERGLGIIASEYDWNSGGGTETGWTLGDDWGCSNAAGSPCPPADQIYFSVFGSGGSVVRAYANNFAQNYLDQWVLVTGVFKPGQYVKLYINGEEKSSTATNISSIVYSADTPLRIGHRADNDYQGNWIGRIDDVKIYNRALSASEIAGLMKPNVLECVFNVPARGNPQQTITDNYQSVAEGRSVYVGATNRRANALWSDIYLMSYSQGASNNTIEIFNRLLDPEQLTGRWSFNANVSNHRVCDIYGYFEDTTNICSGIGTSNFDYCSTLGTPAACNNDAVTYGCYWDSQFEVCLGKMCEAIYCENDFECPNLSCNANKEKIVRDAERYGDLRDLQLALNRYGQTKGGYPTLGGGTYVPNTTFSQWPSWQQTLGADLGGRLYVDPINRFVGCSDHYCDDNESGTIDSGERTFCLVGDVDACSSRPYLCLAIDPDQEVTCWDEITKQFSCPAQMFSYAYNAINGGGDYALYTSFEYDQIGSWRSLPGYFCDTNNNGSIQIDQETIRCTVNADCTSGACLASAEADLYELPLTSTDVECRELNFTLDAATISGGVSPAECAARRCYGGTNDPENDECNSGEVTECPDSGPGTYCTGDADYDGICDVDVGTDNCNPFLDCKANPRDCYNPDQRDSGGIPGKGDVCDATCGADTDSDGVCDSSDTCRNVYNPANASCLDGHSNRTNGQCDYDLDNIGDACDPCTDLDRDGFWDKNTPANTCLADNCAVGLTVSNDRFGYCSGDLSIQCSPGAAGNTICAGAGAGSCVQQTGSLATYNPYQEDYDGDGVGYICDFCIDFDGDSHGDYPFYTSSMFVTTLTPNQQQHFSSCTSGTAWPGNPGNINDIDNCPGGPFGAECTDEFGIEVSCYNPSGTAWEDLNGTSHTGQKDFNLDGIGDICDEFRVGLVNCGDGITDPGGGEACDCGKYALTSDPSSPIVCSTINDQPCNPGYDSNVGNGLNNCNWCYRCQEVKNEEAGYCGDDIVQAPQENCERGNAGCDNSCQNFEPAEYCDANGYDSEVIHFNSPTGQTSHNFLNTTPVYFYIPECSITNSTEVSFDIDITGSLPDTGIVFVTDVSGSMAGTRITDAKAAIINTINDFAATAFAGKIHIGLVSYSTDKSLDSPLVKVDNPTNVQNLIAKVNAYDAVGGTEPDKAVQEATTMLGSFTGNRIMIFMTDGDSHYTYGNYGPGEPVCYGSLDHGSNCHVVPVCEHTCAYTCNGSACQECTATNIWGACTTWTNRSGTCCPDCPGSVAYEFTCSAASVCTGCIASSSSFTNDSDIAKGAPYNIVIYGAAFTGGTQTANPTEVNLTSSNCLGGSCSSNFCNSGYCFGEGGLTFEDIYGAIYDQIVEELGYSFSVLVDGVMTTPIDLPYQSPTGGSYPNQTIDLPSNICTSGTVNPSYPDFGQHTLQLVGLPSGIQASFSGAAVNYCTTCDEDNDGVMDASCGGADCNPANANIPVAELIAAGNCTDNIDNDCDGTKDGADIGCVDPGGGGTIQEGIGNCADGIDNDVDSRTDCADPECVGKPGPNGVTCCQVGTDCSTYGTGQCNACSNNVCVAVTAINGSNCEGTCSFCSNGTCVNRETGDGRECPAGWACTGPAATAYCSPNVSAENCSQAGDEDGDGLADCADVDDCDGHTAPDGGICCTDSFDCGGTCQTCSPTAKRCVPYTGLNGGLCSGACTYCSNGSCVARTNGDGLECPVGTVCSGMSCVDPGASNDCTVPSSKVCPFQQGVCSGSRENCVAPGVWPGCDYQTYVNHAASTGKTYEAGFESLCTDGQDNDCDGQTDSADSDCGAVCNDNGTCDGAENCSNCPDECACLPGQLCCGAATYSCEVPDCNANIDCNDSNASTIDVCQGAATCNATCIHTPITACSNGDGYCPAGCTASNDTDCAPVAACQDTDGGSTVYTTQGTVSDGVGGAVFAPRTDSCSGNVLTEYGCNGANFTSSTYNCASVANTICSNGACVLQAGVNSCSDSDGGANYTTIGTVSGQVDSANYTHTDQCASGTTLTEWTCSGTQAVSSSPAFDCTTLGAGYTCSNGRCIAPPPVFVNYYCNTDGDSAVSSSVTINCQQGTVNCPPAGQGCVTAPGTDCNDSNSQIYPGAPETACNGVNNDCDAQTDEDYAVISGPTCGVGACQTTGQLVCQSGTITDTCTPLPPSTEVCGDSVDNDCNGIVDNGCINECTPGEQISCGALDPVNYKGVCAAPTITCNALGAWPRTECTAQKKTSEVGFCTDNLDNDCDGFADCQETTDCPAGNVCSGNCLAGATCNVSAGPTQFDWICNAQPAAFCGGTGTACGLCVEVSAGNFQCQSNASACSGGAGYCGVCQDQGGGVNFSCAPNNNACTAVCTTCSSSTLSCVTVVNNQDTDGANQCHDTVGCSGTSCSCSVAGVCQNCEDNDHDGLCNEIDVCPYDPDNDLDNDGLCAVGCFSGPSRFGSLTNGYICDAAASNVLRDTCQGGSNQDSGGLGGVPDDCEINSCKVVFGAQDYLNIYINGKLVTGNLSLPQYVSGNPPADVIDNVFVSLDDYIASGENVIAIEAYVEKARGSYPDYAQAYRQIRGAFAKVTDPSCTTTGCGLCDASSLSGTALRTDPVSGSTNTPDMPLKCLVVNDTTSPAPTNWNKVGFSESGWSDSANGSAQITNPFQEIEERLWSSAYYSSVTSPRYNSPKAVWAGGNYTSTSKIYCRYTFIK